MIIYILHQNCYYTFEIKTNVNGKYIISDYDSSYNFRSLVNVEVVDGKCYINDNNNARIFFNGNQQSKIELMVGNFYTLKLINGETVVLYSSLLYDNTFVQKKVEDDKVLKIGRDSNDDIMCLAINKDKVELSYKNGRFHIKSVNNIVPIYVNRLLKNDIDLNNFDCVFVCGIKIVPCKDTIFINNINGKVNFNSKYLSDVFNEQLVVAQVDNDFSNFVDFYDSDKYFFKSPVFQHKADELKINIIEPPQQEEKDRESVIMTIVPTFLMSTVSFVSTIYSVRQFNKGQISSEDLVTSVIISVTILLAGVFWPFIEKWVNNIKATAKNRIRKKKYLKYLDEKEEIFKKASTEQKVSLTMNNPPLSECKNILTERKPELFNRNIDNDNFLKLRLGNGKVKLDCNLDFKKQEYVIEKDPLIENLEQLIDKYEYIEDVPFLLSLKEKSVCAFIIENNLLDDYYNSILLQILTYHSYLDLKIVVLTSKISGLSYLKNTNHCWNNDRDIRYYATNVNDAQNLSSILERELTQRKLKEEKQSSPYYLIISDCINIYRNLNIVDDVINYGVNYNFGLLMFDTKIANIPNKCPHFVSIFKNEGASFDINMSASNINHFKPEFISNEKGVDIYQCAKLLSNIPLSNNDNISLSLPDNYGFLEMYNIGNIEQLNIGIRWDNSDLYNSLAAPLGIDANGNIIYLDLHEKNHGPHGLIAGMTGSGKSELIITYILSMSVNYRPDEVQFVLIDYKGGGLAGAFENRKTGLKLPHLVGTITNLDKSEMKRTLVSIKSELQRRQRLFNEAKESLDSGNIDIYKYQRLFREGKIGKNLSHLFIICDEFAELKAQQPDFMEELVSAARIGRSLGIHLILSTQKPSGIVDDQIWSNSKFKISCKVQTTEDSNEVIRKPDAAFLKESGRFYLQVGYDEYFIEGQAAYTGNIYTPAATFTAKIDNSISFINDSGEAIRNVKINQEDKKMQKSLGDELNNVLKHIISVAEQRNIKTEQLWLNNVPHIVYQNNLSSKYLIKPIPFVINPLIGEFDDPKNQRQGPVCIDITNNGNLSIFGSAGSGKTTLLSTFIYASIVYHNCYELNMYIIDCGTEKLTLFQNSPQVGEVLTISDSEKIKYLFYMISEEMTKRQKFYSQNGNDFLSEVKQGAASFSNMIIIINDIDAFKEVYDELYDEQFVSITRNCSKYGIYFIVSALTVNSLGFLADGNFPQKLVLNLNDSSDYLVIFNNPPIPNKNPGRGIIKLDEPFEFQTALVFREIDYSKNMNYIFEQLNRFLKNHAKKIPIVPKHVTFDLIENSISSLDAVPLGIDEKTAQICYYNFDKFMNLIAAEDNKILSKVMPNMIKTISMCKNTKVIVLNTFTQTKYCNLQNVKEFSSGFKDIFSTINKSLLNSAENDKSVFVIILGFVKLQNHFNDLKKEDPSIVTPLELIINSKKNGGYKYLIYESDASFAELKDSPIYDLCDDYDGIWLGPNFNSQSSFDTSAMNMENYVSRSDCLIVIDDSNYKSVKFVK